MRTIAKRAVLIELAAAEVEFEHIDNCLDVDFERSSD